MRPVADGNKEGQGGVGAVAVFQADILDVRAELGNGRGHRRQHALLIFHHHADFHRKLALDIRLPDHVHPLFRLVGKIHQILAGGGVNHDAAAGAQESDHVVSGDGVTALAEVHHHSLRALDVKRLLTVFARDLLYPRNTVGKQPQRHQRRDALAEADFLQQLVDAFEVVLLEQRCNPLCRHVFHRQRFRCQRLGEQPLPQLDGLSGAQML